MQISTRGIVNLCLPCVVSRKYNQYLICIYIIGNEKKQILELFNMKLSKTIDQTRTCKKSYFDPLGYFCMVFFYLSRRTSDQQISLVQRTFPLVPDNRTNVIVEACGFRGDDFLEINQSETRIACGGHVC